MKAVNDSKVICNATLFCNFHYIQGKQGKFKGAGFGKYIRYRNQFTDKGKYIYRVYVVVKSLAYLPLELSKALVNYFINQVNSEEFIEKLGLQDQNELLELLDNLSKDLRLHGSNISWFQQLTEANVWLDMTSNSVMFPIVSYRSFFSVRMICLFFL